jgi:hypothetical protein
LLQNENGPCPLLAAANCLLLKGAISLPSQIVVVQVVTIDQLVNILAEKVLVGNTGNSNGNGNGTPSDMDGHQQQQQQQQKEHHIQEVLTVFPSLQFGMDVNPKFTMGPSGVEYTMQLNAFDLLHVELVHGWLIDPTQVEYDLIAIGGQDGQTQPQHQTYNQLVNQIIKGNEASSLLDAMHASQNKKNNGNDNVNGNDDNTLIDVTTTTTATTSTEDETTEETRQKHHDLSTLATQGSLLHGFLEQSSHQLTQYGLGALFAHLQEGALCVFFRNNHFNTLTKHDGMLYLLVTDLGYATVDIMWEKLDVIDGDTEYCTADFVRPPPLPPHTTVNATTGEQQSQADYHLALQLSREETAATVSSGIRGGNGGNGNGAAPVEANTGASTPGAVTVLAEDQDVQAALQASLHEYQQQQQHYNPPEALPTTSLEVHAHGTTPTPTPTPTRVIIPPAQPAQQQQAASGAVSAPPMVAMGVQMTTTTCEEADRLLALQLERESMPADDDQEASHRLAMKLHRNEQEIQRQRAVDRPARPPGRLPTTPPPRNAQHSAKKDNCVLM